MKHEQPKNERAHCKTDSWHPENENPGAAATATGAKDVLEGVCFFADYTAAFPILAMHWGALV